MDVDEDVDVDVDVDMVGTVLVGTVGPTPYMYMHSVRSMVV